MWWWYLFPAALTGSAAWVTFTGQRARLRARLDIVASCGLRPVETPNPWAPYLKIKAFAEPLEVLIKEQYDSIRVVIGIQRPPPGFSGVRIRRDLYKPSRAREIEIGDEAFDSTFFLEGPMRLVHTLLDAGARRLLTSINDKARLEIAVGEIRAEMDNGQLSLLLPLLVDLGRRFAERVDVAQRLAGNAREDPVVGVRLRNLLLLVREFPGEPVTVEALRTGCMDTSPQIQFRAAQALGDEGRDTLLKLAESPLGDTWSAQAISALDRELPFENLRTLLTRALRRRQIQTARACLEVLGRNGAAAVETLVKVMEREGGELAVAAALALGEAGDAAAEPPLIRALQRDNADLQGAAANALGRVGSTAAVLPLKEAAERNSDLRRAARQAIAEIQSRVPGASPGQLSLAGAEAGQLSLATDPAGQLSLPE